MSTSLQLRPWTARYPSLAGSTLATLMAPWCVILPELALHRLIEAVMVLEQALQQAPLRQHLLARHGYTDAGLPATGGFICYDFHLNAAAQPRLIEINANAGGLLVNRDQGWGRDAQGLESVILSMLKARWRQCKNRPLRRILILDDHPQEQFLYPEFLLYRDLFQRYGYAADIVDGLSPLPADDGQTLIYNRLTDFHLTAHPELARRTLLPCPQTHALYADKRNLIDLRDPRQHLQLTPAHSQLLRDVIPEIEEMQMRPLQTWWQERKQWFFKPAIGYGSKAAYAGDKITRGTLADIYARGDYLAQALEPASQLSCAQGELKMDLRAYAYAGEIIRLAARLYRGQTTNFRTPGGGFAAVMTAQASAG